MNSIPEYLAAAAAAALVGTGTFLYQSAEQVELSAQDYALPLIVCYDFTTTAVSNAVGKEFVSAAITLYFATSRPGQGDSPEAHRAAVAAMEALRQEFLRALVALDNIDPAKLNARSTPFSNYTSSELDGVGAQFTLTVPAASLVVVCL